MRDIRIQLDRYNLIALRNTIHLFAEEECVGETLYSMHSILMMMGESIDRRIAARPVRAGSSNGFRFTLRLHEAIALRRAALVGIDLFEGRLSIQNELRQVVLAIDPLLPVNCKPY